MVLFTILPFLRPDIYNIEFISQTKLGYTGEQYVASFRAKRFKFDICPYGINIYSTDDDVISWFSGGFIYAFKYNASRK